MKAVAVSLLILFFFFNDGLAQEDIVLPVNVAGYSKDKSHYWIFQSDGNFVVYRAGSTPVPIWTSKTNGNGTACVLQADGNLVVYNGSTPTWASNTNVSPSVLSNLGLSDAGELYVERIYGCNRVIVWSSTKGRKPEADVNAERDAKAKSNPCLPPPPDYLREFVLPTNAPAYSKDKSHYWIFTQDGNFIVYRAKPTIQAIWATNTNGKGTMCVLQADGNLVVYNGTSTIWASNSNGYPYFQSNLGLTDAGELYVERIYDNCNRVIVWSSTKGRKPEADVNAERDAKIKANPCLPPPPPPPAPVQRTNFNKCEGNGCENLYVLESTFRPGTSNVRSVVFENAGDVPITVTVEWGDILGGCHSTRPIVIMGGRTSEIFATSEYIIGWCIVFARAGR